MVEFYFLHILKFKAVSVLVFVYFPSDTLPKIDEYWFSWSWSCVAATCLLYVIIIHYHFIFEIDLGGLGEDCFW